MEKSDLRALAKDFAKWGANRIQRIAEMTKRYGVLFSSEQYSDGKKG